MIHVTAALITQEDKVLIARKRVGKPLAGYWEFPGGKVEPGETKEACLIRELKEEMGIDIEVGTYVGVSEYDYGDKVVALHGYTAELLKGKIQLTDHDTYEWVEVGKLLEYPLAPADILLAQAYVMEFERKYTKKK